MHSSLASSQANPGCSLMTLSNDERFSSERQVRATILFQLNIIKLLSNLPSADLLVLGTLDVQVRKANFFC